MDNLSMDFNEMIMQEIGFEIGHGGVIVDQDTGLPVQLDGKDLMAPGNHTKTGVEFDPYNSTRQMFQLFSYYTGKLAEEGSAPEYDTFFTIDEGKTGQAKVRMKNSEEELDSGIYIRDQCRYADLIMRLNGDDNPDLKRFDVPKTQAPVKKKTPKLAKKKG